MVNMEAVCRRFLKLTKKFNFLTGAPCLFFSNVSLQSTSFDSENVPSILDRCLNIDSLRKVHACILVRGLENDSYLASKLRSAYANFDLLTESRWVFNKIIDNSPSSWKSSFAGYSEAGYDDEFLKLYLELRRRGFGIDSSAIIFCLKSCVQSGNFLFGKTVHVDTYKFGLNASSFVGSSLIGLYAKHDNIESAAEVFDEITERDVVVYTSMVTGYAQAGDHQSYRAFQVVKDMQREELEPNRVTLVSLLQAASHLGALKEGKSIHGFATRKGIGWLDEVFETSLMTMYMRSGPPGKAAVSFSKISRKTIGSWNALIAGHLQTGYPLEALQLFLQMVQEDYIPDLITLANGLLSCADICDLAAGKCIHGYIIRNSIQLDLVATTALIDMYSKCKRLSLAKEVFDRMGSRDTGSFNVMIVGYLENGFSNLAVEKFREMTRMGFRPNVSTILNLLSALSAWNDAAQVKCVQGSVIRHGFEASTEVANQLIHVYTNCSSIYCARKIFDRLQNKDIISWTAMITGYVTHGLAGEAVVLFRQMQVENINLDVVTLVSLLQAFTELGYLSMAREIHCHVYRKHRDEEDRSILNSLLTTYSKSGKLTVARNLFDHMVEQSLAAWNSMISGYGMHGDCAEALKLFEQMKKDKVVIPDELTFRSVLSACSHSGYIEEGLSVFQSMKEEYQRMPSDEHYGCVIDMLSRAGHLEEAYNLVKCLPSTANTTSALCALLAACRVQGNTDMGHRIGRRLLELDPHNPSTINLISHLYAEQEKWEIVAELRGNAKEREGLKKPFAGHSLIDLFS